METVEYLKNITTIIQSVLTSLAIIIGGIWTYRKYIQKREGYPKASIEHEITHRMVNDGVVLISADVIIHNISEVQLSLQSREVILSQILPPAPQFHNSIRKFDTTSNKGKRILEWDTLHSEINEVDASNNFILEPGESHQFHRDYLISSNVETLMLYSYFRNIIIQNRALGWELKTIYDLKKEEPCMVQNGGGINADVDVEIITDRSVLNVVATGFAPKSQVNIKVTKDKNDCFKGSYTATEDGKIDASIDVSNYGNGSYSVKVSGPSKRDGREYSCTMSITKQA